MSISKSEYRGFTLKKHSTINGIEYFEFTKTIKNLEVPSADKIRRKLMPVEFEIRVKKISTEDYVMLRRPLLMGHPELAWHPHVEWNGWVCWGGVGEKQLCYNSGKLSEMLDRNYRIAIGVLSDFARHGYHSAEQVRDNYSTRIGRPTRGRAGSVLPLSEAFWNGDEETDRREAPPPPRERERFELRVHDPREIVALAVGSGA